MNRCGAKKVRRSPSQRHRTSVRPLRFEALDDRLVFAVLDLGQANVTIFGVEANDESGVSVSSAGDVNGDGFDDFVIGARYADAANNSKNSAGESYLLFGKANWAGTPTIDLANLGTAGVVLYGANALDYSGRAVSSAGDVNGDGFDDFLIGAVEADAANNVKPAAGDTYLIFGKPNWSATPSIDLANLGTAGVTFFGTDTQDYSGRAVSGAGDVNGDGFEDLLIGAHYGDGVNNARLGSGETALIFGKPDWSATPTVDLGNLGPSGVTFHGVNLGDGSGLGVSNGGDVNGDGFDDLLIGARYGDAASNSRDAAGDSYIVFGKSNWSGTLTLDLANLGTAGVTIFGADIEDYSGLSLSSAGDMNGDGFDDVLIGAVGGDLANNDTLNAGESYLLFGKANWSGTPTINLANLGAAGVTFYGVDSRDNAGLEVNQAGDVNGDGFDDLLIGARYGDALLNTKANAGDSYLVFGKSNWAQTFFLSTLGSAGITLFGVESADYSGFALNAAGDVNGDGFDDFLIGAAGGDGAGNARVSAGESYLVFGGDQFTSSVTHLGTGSPETLTGTKGSDVMVGHRSDDVLIGSGGADVLRGGQGNDVLAVSDLTYKRLVGGNGTDTLRLDGTGLALNLTSRLDNRTQGIEQIDLTGSGPNSLTLNVLEVLNLSDESNTLVVFRDADDTVLRGPGWTRQADEVIDGRTFEVYTQGAAILKIEGTIADVSITKTPSVSSVLAGGSFAYAIEVANSGPSTATGVTVSDPLPVGLLFDAANSSSDCSATPAQLVTCSLGSVNIGASETLQIAVKVSSSVSHGAVINNTATLTINESDPTTSDQIAAASITVNRQADLFVTKTASADPVFAGGTFTYTVKIENRGPSDASGVVIGDTLPDGLAFLAGISSSSCSAVGQLVTCNVGVVAAGTSNSPRIVVNVSPSVLPGTVLSNTANVSSNEADPTPGDHSATLNITVDRLANLRVTKTASTDLVLAGGSFQYFLEVSNAGPSAATGVVVTDTLPTAVSFDAAASSPMCTAVAQDVTCSFGNMAATDILTRTIAVTVASSVARGTVLDNTASVNGNEPDPNPNDQSSTAKVTVTVSPDPFPWQNVRNRLDVNDDRSVSPIDVLQIINELNSPRFSGANGKLPVPPAAGPHPFYDVSGDNFVVPNDALTIINFLNAAAAGEGEGASDGLSEGEWESGRAAAGVTIRETQECRVIAPSASLRPNLTNDSTPLPHPRTARGSEAVVTSDQKSALTLRAIRENRRTRFRQLQGDRQMTWESALEAIATEIDAQWRRGEVALKQPH